MRAGLLTIGLIAASALWSAPVDSRLADAVMRSDKSALRALLQQKVDVDSTQGDGMTALHWAAYRNDFESAKLLIAAGASTKAVTRNGNITPLALACANGSGALVEALLQNGADANGVVLTGETALMAAAHAGNLEAVNALLNHGAKVNQIEPVRGQTALMWATAENHPEIMKVLIARGADINIHTAVVNYRKARAAAVARESDPICAALTAESCEAAKEAAKKEVGIKGSAKIDPICAGLKPDACEAAKEAAVKEAGKAPVAAVDAAKLAPTKALVAKPEVEVDLIGKPVGMGGTVREASYSVMGGMTAFLFTAREGHIEAARVLVEAGVDLDQATTGDKSNALVLAIENGNYDLAKYLLEKGADPNVANMYGEAALYAAVDFRNVEKSWRPTVKTDQGKTDSLELIKLILDRGGRPNVRLKEKLPYRPSGQDRAWVYTSGATPFWRAAVSDDVAVMKLLVARGADPNISSDEKVTPLMVAAGLGWEGGQTQTWPAWMEAVKLCLDFGNDINGRDVYGYTALHGAAYRGDTEMVQYLVDHGANPNFKSLRGHTPRDMANGVYTTADLPLSHPDTVALLDRLMLTKGASR